MSKKKKHKHFGNPAKQAKHRQEELTSSEPESTQPSEIAPVVPASGFTAAPEVRAEQAINGSQHDTVEEGVRKVSPAELLEMYQELQEKSLKIQEENINLQTDFKRVLQSYAALITNTFKLNITMDEFDVNEPRTVERLQSKFSFFIEDLPRNCEKAGISMPNLVGLDYTPGLNVEAMNADEFEPGTALEIDEVVEPLLIFDPKNSGAESGSVRAALKNGVVTVKKKGE